MHLLVAGISPEKKIASHEGVARPLLVPGIGSENESKSKQIHQ
jgi:hypothetical protein